MFNQKTETMVDWKGRAKIIAQITSLKEEKDRVVSPLRESFDRLLEWENELGRAQEKLESTERKFNEEIFEKEKLLKLTAPECVDMLISELKSQLQGFGGKRMIERTENKSKGKLFIRSNHRAIAAAEKMVTEAISEAEGLKLTAGTEDDLSASLSKIKRRVKFDIESELAKPLIEEK
jgi:hypothetical protein